MRAVALVCGTILTMGLATIGGCATPAAPRGAVAAAGAAERTDASSARRAFHLDGFARPESVVYDEVRDRYLVSNLNGAQPGFVSVVDPAGRMVAARWIESERGGVTLRDPHGMGILDGLLYVADTATVRTFYVADGTPAGDIEIVSATSLSDVAVDSVTGRVYVSDCATLPSADGSRQANGGDAIYVIEKRVVRPLAQGRQLRNPNGLASDGAGGVWVADGDGRIYRIESDGAIEDVARGPGKSLDGIVLLGSRMFVSDRDSGAIWERGADGGWSAFIRGVVTPAGIGFDSKRHRLLVPSLRAGALEAWDL